MKKIKFLKSVHTLSGLPKDSLPEVLLCGRSNVGKSTFINTVFNRKDLAQTSSSPGKTRALNYYLVEEKFYLVDLPGFGYAKVSKSERDRWGKLIQDYFSSSSNKRLAFQFIDSRHNPTELDLRLNSYLMEHNIPFIIILSKVDKLKQSEKAKVARKLKEFFPELNIMESVIPFSSLKKIGKPSVISLLKDLFN